MAIAISAVAAVPALPEGRPIPKEQYYHINAQLRNCVCFSADSKSKRTVGLPNRPFQTKGSEIHDVN